MFKLLNPNRRLRPWLPKFVGGFLGSTALSLYAYGAIAGEYSSPSLVPPGLPSAFVANWGDYYIYTAAFAYQEETTKQVILPDGFLVEEKTKEWLVDGTSGAGFGLGSSKKNIGVQIGLNYSGYKVGDNDVSIDVALGRTILEDQNGQIAIGTGLKGLSSFDDELDTQETPYVALSAVKYIKVDPYSWRTIMLNVGYGGGSFQDSGRHLSFVESGFFASVGIQLSSNFGVSAAWEGDSGLALGASWAPIRKIPIKIDVGLKNLTTRDQSSIQSSIVPVFSIVWGDNFRTPSFPD